MFHKSDPVCTLGLGLDQLVAGIRGVHMTEGSGVGAVTGHSPDFDFAGQRHTEAEDVLAGLLADLLAVDVEGDGLLVGVDLTFISLSVRSVNRLEQMWTNASSLHHAL